MPVVVAACTCKTHTCKRHQRTRMFIPGHQMLDIHATDTGLHLNEMHAVYNLDVDCRTLWEQLLPHGSIIPWRLHEMIGNIDQLIVTHLLCRNQHNTDSKSIDDCPAHRRLSTVAYCPTHVLPTWK